MGRRVLRASEAARQQQAMALARDVAAQVERTAAARDVLRRAIQLHKTAHTVNPRLPLEVRIRCQMLAKHTLQYLPRHGGLRDDQFEDRVTAIERCYADLLATPNRFQLRSVDQLAERHGKALGRVPGSGVGD